MILTLPLIGILIPNKCGQLQTYYPSCHLHDLVFQSAGQKKNAFDLDGFHIMLIYSTRSITQYGPHGLANCFLQHHFLLDQIPIFNLHRGNLI